MGRRVLETVRARARASPWGWSRVQRGAPAALVRRLWEGRHTGTRGEKSRLWVWSCPSGRVRAGLRKCWESQSSGAPSSGESRDLGSALDVGRNEGLRGSLGLAGVVLGAPSHGRARGRLRTPQGGRFRFGGAPPGVLTGTESALGPPRLTFLAFLPPMGAIFVVSGLKLGTDVDLRGLCVCPRSPELPRGCSRALYTCSSVGWFPQPPRGPTAGLGQGTRPPAFY